jgi:recombination protein RecR
MSLLPEPLEKLILALERLPGIGPKTASRLAFFLLRAPAEISGDLAEALRDIKTATALCQQCYNIFAAGREK